MSHNPSPLQSLNRGLIQGLAIGQESRRSRREEEAEKTLRQLQERQADIADKNLELKENKARLDAFSTLSGLLTNKELSRPERAGERAILLSEFFRVSNKDPKNPQYKALIDFAKATDEQGLKRLSQCTSRYAAKGGTLEGLSLQECQKQLLEIEKEERASKSKREDRSTETQVVQTRTPEGDKLTVLVNKQTGEVIREIGRGPSKIEVTRPSAGERKELAFLRSQGGQMDFLVKTVAKFKGNIGPVAGRAFALKAAAGLLSEDEADFFAQLAGLRNIILKLRSGGAVTPEEADRLIQELPTLNDQLPQFIGKAKAFKRNIDRIHREIRAGFKDFDDPTPRSSTDVPPGIEDSEVDERAVLGPLFQ